MRLFLVIPCYNEQEVLPLTARAVADKMHALVDQGRVAADSRVLLVDDGSCDGTWPLICSLHAQDPLFCGLKLSTLLPIGRSMVPQTPQELWERQF